MFPLRNLTFHPFPSDTFQVNQLCMHMKGSGHEPCPTEQMGLLSGNQTRVKSPIYFILLHHFPSKHQQNSMEFLACLSKGITQ